MGWYGDNVLVQDARRPFRRRMTTLLQVDGLPAVTGLPSEQRVAAGIDTLGFYSYPLLFYTLFPRVSLAQLRSLSVAGSFLFDHVLCLDALLDRSSPPHAATLLLSGELYREAVSRLHALFPPASPFWGHFDRYHAHFCQAVLAEESRHRALVHPYDDDLETIYAGKTAVAKACLAALAVLDGDEEVLACLEASHDAFYVGFQLADDLEDWRLDYRRGHYSYPLTRAFLSAGWERRVEADERPSVAEVGDLLARSGVAEETRRMALACFDRADSHLGPMVEGSWRDAIRHSRERVARSGFDTGADEAPVAPGAPAGEARVLWTGPPATVAPIARAWRRWLDASRHPRIGAPEVVDEQWRVLHGSGGASTVGAALCQVGLAVHASMGVFPEHGLAAHLGVSTGELEWFRSHDAWLDALLAIGLDDPPELWKAGDPASGWVPPAVGRYLGYRLVDQCTHELAGGAAPTVDAVLGHYRRRLVA